MTKTKTSLYSKFPNWTSIFLIISFFSLSDFPSTNWIERKIYFRFPWKNTSTSWWKLYLVNNLIQSWASNQCCYIRLFCHASYFISILDQSRWRDYWKLYCWLKQWLNTIQFEKVVLRIVTTILIWTGPWVAFVAYPNQS